MHSLKKFSILEALLFGVEVLLYHTRVTHVKVYCDLSKKIVKREKIVCGTLIV